MESRLRQSMHNHVAIIIFFSLFIIIFPLLSFSQPDCSATSTGFTPINDLGTGTFTNAWGETWTGGLYPGGSNDLPAAHKAAGLQLATEIAPRDSSGNPDKINGKIVWLSIGMSNATQESRQFIPLANAYENKNPNLVFVDGAQGAMVASVISSPWNTNYATFWSTVNARLNDAGVTARQVQVIWFKEADPGPMYPSVHHYYDSMVVSFKRIMNEIKARFPNTKLCYMASRLSARYATTRLNPEPYSYYTGWAVKKVIEDQINGNARLAYKGIHAKSPWLCWGIYMWSDGSTPQKTNPDISWDCPVDFNNDGIHPSIAGAQKVGRLLLEFYKNDSVSCPWFFNKPPEFCTR